MPWLFRPQSQQLSFESALSLLASLKLGLMQGGHIGLMKEPGAGEQVHVVACYTSDRLLHVPAKGYSLLFAFAYHRL